MNSSIHQPDIRGRIRPETVEDGRGEVAQDDWARMEIQN